MPKAPIPRKPISANQTDLRYMIRAVALGGLRGRKAESVTCAHGPSRSIRPSTKPRKVIHVAFQIALDTNVQSRSVVKYYVALWAIEMSSPMTDSSSMASILSSGCMRAPSFHRSAILSNATPRPAIVSSRSCQIERGRFIFWLRVGRFRLIGHGWILSRPTVMLFSLIVSCNQPARRSGL